MKTNLFRYVFPAAMVAGFLCFFFYDILHYIPNLDDRFNYEYVSKMGIVNAAKLFFSNINGRWFSHMVTAISFYFIQDNYSYYAFYLCLMLGFFIFSLGFFLQAFVKKIWKQVLPFGSSLRHAVIFTAVLFFLLFAGREEIWAWVSSVNNHLLSVILSLLLFGLLFRETNKPAHTGLIIFLGAAIGGLNEVNAVCTALAVGSLFFLYKNYYPKLKFSKLNLMLAVFFILI